MKRYVVALLCVLWMLPSFAVAENGNSSTNEEPAAASETAAPTLGEVIISATRSEDEAFLSDRSLNVIGSEKITQHAPRSLPELLRESTGVFVQHTNYGGGSPILRGMVGPQVLLLVDGIRLNNSVFRTGPLQYANLIDPYAVERLEVVRGPGSVLYGSDAMGGAIQALTFFPRDRRYTNDKADGRGLIKLGSASREATYHGMLDSGFEGFGFNVNATYRDFHNLRAGGDVGAQPYSNYSQVNSSGKLMYRFNGAADGVTLSAGYMLTRMYDVGRAENLEVKDSYNLYQNDHYLAFVKAHFPVAAMHTDFDLTFAYQRFFEEKDSVKLDESHETELKRTRDHTTVDTFNLDVQGTTKLFEDRLRITFGGEYNHDDIDSSRQNRSGTDIWTDNALTPFPDGSSYQLGGGYVYLRGKALPTNWAAELNLNAGYRIQYMGGKADANGSNPAADYSNLAHVAMAGIQANYLHYFTSAFTWSQGVRAPNLQESVQVGDTGDWYHVPNNDLKPERSNTLELLLRFDTPYIYGSGSGYVSFISDVIKRVSTTTDDGQDTVMDKQVVHNVNGGKARMYGTEGELGFRFGHGVSLDGSVTYTYGTEEKSDGGEIPLSKIPPLFGRVALRWEHTVNKDLDVLAEAYVLWATKQDRLSENDLTDVRIPEGGTPGWATVNLRVALDLYQHARLTLNAENLLDKKYKYHASGIYSPGTNVIVGVEGRF